MKLPGDLLPLLLCIQSSCVFPPGFLSPCVDSVIILTSLSLGSLTTPCFTPTNGVYDRVCSRVFPYIVETTLNTSLLRS